MRRLVPVAGIESPFSRAADSVDDLRAIHSGAVGNAEVGIGFSYRGPGIAAHRPDNHRVGVLEVIKPQVAWKADENTLRIVLGQVREVCGNLQIDKRRQLLGAQILGAVRVHAGKRQLS